VEAEGGSGQKIADLGRANDALAAAQRDAEQITRSANDLRAENREQRLEIEKRVRHLTNDIESLSRRNDNLQAENASIQRSQGAELRVDELKAVLAETDRELTRVRLKCTRIKSLKRQVENLSDENALLKTELSRRGSGRSSPAHLDGEFQVNRDLRTVRDDLADENASLRRALTPPRYGSPLDDSEELRERVKKLEKKVKAMDAENTQLRDRIAMFQQLGDAEGKLKKVHDVILDDNEELSGENDRLKQRIAALSPRPA
jgi:predicted RNase H-like nuclease (RuvC/YqgF family)